MARWMAPILSFTAEEIWENLPGEREDSVLLAGWGEPLLRLSSNDSMDAGFWDQLISVRTAVNKQLEVLRGAGELRGSLDAKVTLYCDGRLAERLASLGDELRFVLITSEATVADSASAPDDSAATEVEGLRLMVRASDAEKCERCWHRRPDVATDAAHPTLCARCVSNVQGPGEERRFA
jgi:isoleucyl-tRNA synthetase